MYRNIIIIICMVAVGVCCVAGCKKSSSGTATEQPVIKSVVEYDAEAQKQINEGNMEKELGKIEKEMEQEASK